MEKTMITKRIPGYDIYGLAYNCPYLLRIDGCPLKEIDNFSFKKKVDWIKGLNDEEKEGILEYHCYCTRKRNIKLCAEGNQI